MSHFGGYLRGRQYIPRPATGAPIGCIASDSRGKISIIRILIRLRGVALISVETIGTILVVLFCTPVHDTPEDHRVLENGISHSVRSNINKEASTACIMPPLQSVNSLGTTLAPGIL